MNLPSEIETALRRSNPELLTKVENALAEATTLNPGIKTLSASEQSQLADWQQQMKGEITAEARAALVTKCLRLRGLHDLFPRRTIAKA